MSESTYQNPFVKIRVDNPFQYHPDLKPMYEKEYNFILSLLPSIKSDPDFQSQIVTITGSPGSGKTHLSMRLASQLMASNRIFYIRQPNNHESVLHFIYSKILESMAEKIPATRYSQFSFFIAKSFATILLKNRKHLADAQDLIKDIEQDPLNLFSYFQEQDPLAKQENQKLVEQTILKWWEKEYSLTGLAPDIIRAIIKFAYETDFEKRQLIFRWINGSTLSMDEAESIELTPHHTDIDNENFAMEAVSVLSRLSIHDEPVIIIFDQLEALDNYPLIFSKFFDTIKEIITDAPNILFIFNIFDTKWNKWKTLIDPSISQRLSQNLLTLQNPPLDNKVEILSLRSKEAGAPLDIFFTNDEINEIAKTGSIREMLIYASHCFLNKTEGIPLPQKTYTFEEKIEARLKELYKEIKTIKKHLNIKSKTPGEQVVLRDTKTFLLEKKKELLRQKTQAPVYSEPEDMGKLLFIADSFIGTAILETGKLKTARKQLSEHILLKGKEKSIAAGFLNMSGISLTSRLKSLSSMCENYPNIKFFLMRDKSSTGIKSSGAHSLKRELTAKHNFKLIELTKEDRINFELLYALVSSIKSLDIEGDEINLLGSAKKLIGKNFVFDILNYIGADI